jgi:hypothetical protein
MKIVFEIKKKEKKTLITHVLARRPDSSRTRPYKTQVRMPRCPTQTLTAEALARLATAMHVI